ncbi:MAG: XdhC family protein [Chitinophagaceae bacterium]|jgi:xanthine/CO dehydrogenase XdhC/CoxF family maturation factor|nr:XdhC family protein [Chitinophagaceae bacterium]
MKEFQTILKAYEQSTREKKRVALATLVHVDGSSYRRPGARMLVTEEGQLTGAISGGCLEGDALQKAMLVMAQQQSRIVTYDTTDEDDDTLGVGLGCNGIIQVLMEPINPADPLNQLVFLEKVVSKRQKAVLVTLFSMDNKKGPQPGTCLMLDEAGEFQGKADPALESILKEDAREAFRNQKSLFKQYISAGGSHTAFIEFIQPAVSLVIVGAGNDAMPLVDMADLLGWDVRVIDGRSSHAKPERFERACQVLVSKPEAVLEQIPIDRQTVFVLMTHNYNYDKAMLKALVQKDIFYIGSLGPKKKLDRMLGELAQEGLVLTDAQRAIIHGPVGLDIGAETSEEIALSILAEIKAVLSGKEGQSLKHIDGEIHAREETRIEQKKIG